MSLETYIENFDVESYLVDRGIEYRTEGKNVSHGWVEVNCPWCDDPSFHLGISPQRRLNCWRCGPHGTVLNYIQVVERCSRRRAIQILYKYQMLTSVAVEPFTVEGAEGDVQILPKSAKLPLPELHREYLIQRGFDPDYIVRKYGVKACGPTGPYKFRLIIPVFLEGEIVTFTSRDVTGKAEVRYKSCPNSRSKIPIKHSLYNIDTVKPGGGVVVVEGPLDVWRIGDGAVATFGTNFTEEQVSLLAKKRPKRAAVVYDAEPEALRKAEELACLLSPFVQETVEIVELEVNDPCELTEKEVRKLRKWFIEV